ncbi:MAG: ATP-grasp domain-containing protein [Candidatus Competibacteraceae bacterium]|nr:ATP-grasp domain-containing protein [Candidatus Competibacteraceae bacterium]
MTLRVLFNQGLSNVHYALSLIQQCMKPDEFRLAAGYSVEHTPLKTVADNFILEPSNLTGTAYAEWLLDCCRRHQIDWLWPQSRLPLLFAYQQEFARFGIRVLWPCLEPDTLAVLEDKSCTAGVLQPHGIALPRWRQFSNIAEFDAALTALGYPHSRLCVKPAIAIYAQGFRVLDDTRDPFERFMHNNVSVIGVEELRTLLRLKRRETVFLALEYLEGDERSIDCLVTAGRLVRSVTRLKPQAAQGRFELIEDNPEGEAIAAQLCRIFGLNGLVNIQTRERILPDGSREQCFLEINARMSGGINMACLSDVILPYWALRLAVGTATVDDIPLPRSNRLVTTIHHAVVLGDSGMAALTVPNDSPIGWDSVSSPSS